MNINTTNYESWFLDYAEGNLSAGQVAELFLFLEQHPDLYDEFNSFEQIHLNQSTPAESVLPDKESLIKSATLSEYTIQEWLTAEIEGQLSQEQLQLLHAFLKEHTSYIRDRELYGKTRLSVDAASVYPDKNSLVKSNDLSEATIREWLIDDTEGLLNLEDKGALLAFLEKHPQYKSERELYRNTILPNDHHISYPRKETLYKGKVIRMTVFSRVLRVAAIVLLLIGAVAIIRVSLKNQSKDTRMAENSSSILKDSSAQENRALPASSYAINEKTLTEVQGDGQKENKKEIAHIPSTSLASPEKRNVKSNPEKHIDSPFMDNSTLRSGANMHAMATLGCNPVKVEEPFVFAERRYTPKATVAYQNQDEPPSLIAFIRPQQLGDDILNLAVQHVNKAAGEELLYQKEERKKLPLGSRLLKFAAKAVGKISNNKVKVRTAFNPVTGKLSAYEVETEKKIIQKQF